MIVSLTEIKNHLHVLSDDDDDKLEALILQAQQAASDICHVDWEDEDDVPDSVCLAIKLMVSYFYENPDCASKEGFETMTKAFKLLLSPNTERSF